MTVTSCVHWFLVSNPPPWTYRPFSYDPLDDEWLQQAHLHFNHQDNAPLSGPRLLACAPLETVSHPSRASPHPCSASSFRNQPCRRRNLPAMNKFQHIHHHTMPKQNKNVTENKPRASVVYDENYMPQGRTVCMCGTCVARPFPLQSSTIAKKTKKTYTLSERTSFVRNNYTYETILRNFSINQSNQTNGEIQNLLPCEYHSALHKKKT